jgi:hypothetical protein
METKSVILEAIWIARLKVHREDITNKAKMRLLVNPNTLRDLMRERAFAEENPFPKPGQPFTIFGIPVAVTVDIEGWELVLSQGK